MLEICPAYIKQMLHLCDARVWNGGEIGPRTYLLDFLAIFTTKHSLKFIFFPTAMHSAKIFVTVVESSGQRPTVY